MIINSIIIFLFIIILFYTTYEYFYKSEFFIGDQETYCNQNNINDTHVLQPPNIPDDWRSTFKIGGKFCKKIKEKNIAPTQGKYTFPIQQLLYDGIYQNDRKIYDNNKLESQKWSIIKKYYPIHNFYASNKYLYVPENHIGQDKISHDKTIFYGDWDILGIRNKNQYNFDNCNMNKHRNHIEGIVYWKSGISD